MGAGAALRARAPADPGFGFRDYVLAKKNVSEATRAAERGARDARRAAWRSPPTASRAAPCMRVLHALHAAVTRHTNLPRGARDAWTVRLASVWRRFLLIGDPTHPPAGRLVVVGPVWCWVVAPERRQQAPLSIPVSLRRITWRRCPHSRWCRRGSTLHRCAAAWTPRAAS